MTIKVTGSDGAFIHISGARLADGADAQAITYDEAAQLAVDLVAAIAERNLTEGITVSGRIVDQVTEAQQRRLTGWPPEHTGKEES